MPTAPTPETASTGTTTLTLPILDLDPYLHHAPGALEQLAGELQDALEHIGFFFIVNHGIPQTLINRVFAQAARFHALPLEEKTPLALSASNTGYLYLGQSRSRASSIDGHKKPNLNAAFFMKRNRPADHPDVLAGKPMRGLNQWPANLPGFRETLLEYFDAMEALGKRLVPLYAVALGLPADYFAPSFQEPQVTLRLSHYPILLHEEHQYGLAPHTDSGFMTFLPQNDVPGLAIRPEGYDWMEPPVLPGSFLVNSGDILRRWTNDRFLSTSHRVLNSSGRDRYAIPYFFDPNTDTVIECLPTCQEVDNPPHYPPVIYEDYLLWFTSSNYHTDAAQPVAPRP
jgi:isopenicillin N synthase-like dioxygenase